MAAFGLVGKLATAPQDRAALIAILTQAAVLMQAVDGCVMYIVSEDADDDGLVWVMELWESQAAHDASLTLPAVRDLIGQAGPLLTGRPEGASLIPISGKGL
jgi:quinol monooxygenase YgiN